MGFNNIHECFPFAKDRNDATKPARGKLNRSQDLFRTPGTDLSSYDFNLAKIPTLADFNILKRRPAPFHLAALYTHCRIKHPAIIFSNF